ncbi:MAG: VCBS repeat-containing protein, partial [Phycisphaerae bacterium]|nr:VCBS repeat-containing protein [Phycisphaerae bacterium]
CLKGPNRCFRNNCNGTFTDITEASGLDRRIFNTRGIAVLDLNKDNVPDLVFVNEGQESAALLGSPARLTMPITGGVTTWKGWWR